MFKVFHLEIDLQQNKPTDALSKSTITVFTPHSMATFSQKAKSLLVQMDVVWKFVGALSEVSVS